MKNLLSVRLALRLTGVTLVAMFCIGYVEPQSPGESPTYGSLTSKSGFKPDPYTKNLTAGGPIRTNAGGINAWVSKAPDFTLFYTQGGIPLTIRAKSKADTTLLVKPPVGTFTADDNGDGTDGFNPRLTFERPKSGRYDIWVGTVGIESAPATLFLTDK